MSKSKEALDNRYYHLIVRAVEAGIEESKIARFTEPYTQIQAALILEGRELTPEIIERLGQILDALQAYLGGSKAAETQ